MSAPDASSGQQRPFRAKNKKSEEVSDPLTRREPSDNVGHEGPVELDPVPERGPTPQDSVPEGRELREDPDHLDDGHDNQVEFESDFDQDSDYEPDFDEAEFDELDESDEQPEFDEEAEFEAVFDGRHPGHGRGPGDSPGPRLAPGPKHGHGHHPAPPHEHGPGPKKHAPGAKKAGPKKAPGPKKHPRPPHEHGPGHHPRPPEHHPGEPGVEPDFGFAPGTGFGSGPVPGFGLGFGFGQTGRGRQRGFGRSRRGRPGDVRAAILTLLAERPMHGYEMIKEIAGRSHDVWRPSPGSVYPTLQMLDDEGLIGGSESEGSKRLFELTQEGRAAVEKIKAPPWEEITQDVDRSQVNIREALGQVVAAVTQSAYVATAEQQQRIVALLKKLRREIYSMLAECD